MIFKKEHDPPESVLVQRFPIQLIVFVPTFIFINCYYQCGLHTSTQVILTLHGVPLQQD